jgi:hypothetical protein
MRLGIGSLLMGVAVLTARSGHSGAGLCGPGGHSLRRPPGPREAQ